mgnify:CR=1 FL=1|jgi:hypothetical protein
MKKIILCLFSIALISLLSHNFWNATTNLFVNNNWGWTIYRSDWSTSHVFENNWWWYYSVYTYPDAYKNNLNNKLEDLKELNKKINSYSEYNNWYKQKLDDDCSKSVTSFVDDAQNACYNKNSSSCNTAINTARKVISVWRSNKYLWDICKYAIELWSARLDEIESGLLNNWSSSCSNLEYFNTYLQKCLERPNYHKWVNNWYKWSDWKAYCNKWYIRNMDLNNCVDESIYWDFRYNQTWCPKNSSLADDGVCYCDLWYKLNTFKDWCIVDNNYCSNTYWSNIKNNYDENWDLICSCKYWFYFNEDEQQCLSVDDLCKNSFWENSNRKSKDNIYSCACNEWFFLNKEWKCDNTEIINSISWMFDNWLTIYNSIDSFMWSDYLTREQASKFFVEFSEKIKWVNVDTSKKVYLKDLTKADKTLQSHIKKANQLWLFKWVNWSFLPFNKLTRAQAIAVIIRSIDWVQDENWTNWYDNYYNVANNYWLIEWLNFDPTSLDSINITRSEVALLLYRLKNIAK